MYQHQVNYGHGVTDLISALLKPDSTRGVIIQMFHKNEVLF